MKSAIITGCTGQDGRILSEFLIKKKINVYGISKNNLYLNTLKVKKFNLLSFQLLKKLLNKVKPEYIFYFASFKHSSEEIKKLKNDILSKSYKVHVTGYKNILDSIIHLGLNTKIFYASSSHIFGPQKFNSTQNSKTLFNPISSYGITKAYATYLSRYYRDHHNLKIYVGIFFNHESEYSSDKFILSKIIKNAIKIKQKKIKKLFIGTTDHFVDIGYAPDYMFAIYEIIKKNKPDDYIISSGSKIKIISLINKVFKLLNLNSKKYLHINKSLLHNSINLNLFGDNKFLKKTKAYKQFHEIDEFIEKIVNFNLQNR